MVAAVVNEVASHTTQEYSRIQRGVFGAPGLMCGSPGWAESRSGTMKKQLCGQLTVGFLALVTMLMVTALPSDAWTGGGFHSGGFHSGGFHHGFRHHPFFVGPRVFVGVGPFFY